MKRASFQEPDGLQERRDDESSLDDAEKIISEAMVKLNALSFETDEAVSLRDEAYTALEFALDELSVGVARYANDTPYFDENEQHRTQ